MMAELPAMHRAAFVQRDGTQPTFIIKDTPLPEPSPYEVLVRLSATGVCGTDIALLSGKLGPTRDILGHEGVGRIVKLGSAIPPAQAAVGDRVGIAWVRDVCEKCAHCLSPGGEARCVEQLNSGRKIDGSFAEYALVPARYIIRVPEGINDEVLAPILCGGVTAYKALRVCGATGGQWVVVSGAGGGVGALAVQYGRAMGFRIVAIDAGEAKGKVCLSAGAEVYIDVLADEDVESAVRQATQDKMAQAVLVAAGSGKAYRIGVDLLGPYGTLVCVGIPPPSDALSIHPLEFIDKGIRVVGSAVGTRADIAEAIEFVQRGIVKPAVQVIELDALPSIVQDFGQTSAKYVIKLTNN